MDGQVIALFSSFMFIGHGKAFERIRRIFCIQSRSKQSFKNTLKGSARLSYDEDCKIRWVNRKSYTLRHVPPEISKTPMDMYTFL